MVDAFREHPGLLYVVATLLPLLSFFLLLIAGWLRHALRTVRETPLGNSLYQLLGGDQPGRTPAYIATGAMGLAFVLVLIGFIEFLPDQAALHKSEEEIVERSARQKKDTENEGDKTEELIKKSEEDIQHIENRWSATKEFGQIELARVGRLLDDSRIGVSLNVGYRIDSLAAIMFLMVTLVATLIHIFSIGYMSEELEREVADHQVHTEHGHLHRRGRFGRFFMYLSLFSFSMLNLVLADNLFQVFVSWELVGICSYLLIGHYYERQSASNAANKAFIVNRVGDAGFIIGLLIIWSYLGTFNFQDIFQRVRSPVRDSFGRLQLGGHFVRGQPIEGEKSDAAQTLRITGAAGSNGSEVVLFPRDQSGHFHSVGPDRDDAVKATTSPAPQEFGSMPYWLLVAAGLGIFLGCVGKSAQFPLQVWLPDAMEGPTPVSALIHAATMVAAGVYLVGRVFPLFTEEARLVIAYTGGITLFVAATIAIVMTDIKKVLAYSTVSQLGYMMLALGVGGWVAGLLHLLTHAFFKALLFLGSGSVIYGCHHEQEMTKMGGLYPKMKTTALAMLVGVLAIAGTPFFSGWYSKDAILSQAFGFTKVHPQHALLFLLPLVTAGITTFYMFRMWFMTFTGEPRDAHVHEHAHESPRTMTMPLVLLAFFSVVVAWGWPLYDPEASWLGHELHHSQPTSVMADFGAVAAIGDLWSGAQQDPDQSERQAGVVYATVAGLLALLAAGIGFLFGMIVYYWRMLDPAEAKEQFPGVYRFLWHKWYFDELYSAIIVRPGLVVANWCRVFDTKVIDGTVDGTARATLQISKWDGKFDLGVIDGLVNLTARVVFAVGGWLRTVQTGYIRSYVLFLVLAAIALFAILTYFVTLAAAG